MKATAIAHSNIAFIKYWGKKDEMLKIPQNGSISMNLSNLNTITTVEFDKKHSKDIIEIEDITDKNSIQKIIKHIDLIRSIAKIKCYAKIKSKNSFPSGTGLSSSASGFAALTLAACTAVNLNLSKKELSIIARQGSGSACRSIPDGFVEWVAGNSNNTSYAKSIFSNNYWEICDIVAIISKEKKSVSSTTGQTFASTSPFYKKRLEGINEKILLIKKLIEKKDFKKFGELCEAEALEMHAVMFTSNPPLIYWQPQTIKIMKKVMELRKNGMNAYFTINTGQDAHILCLEKDVDKIKEELNKEEYIKEIIVNKPSAGARIIKDHLF